MIPWFRRRMSKPVAEKLDFLLKSQYWGLEQIREYQLERLKKLLDHAWCNVPYYRDLFRKEGLVPADIRTLEDLAKLPVLSKRNLQKSLKELVDERVDVSGLAVNSTGGSTGMPLNFYQDDEYVLWSDAARLRAWRYMVGGTEADLEAVLWGAIRDVGKGLTLKQVLRGVLRERSLMLNTFDLDEAMLKQYLGYYNLFAPPILRGYASSLYYLARYLESHRIEVKKPRAVISSTEVLHPRMREAIERVFGCRVFDSYGCREISQIATECPEHAGLHVVFENQYLELDGNEIVITNLNNYLMPFIRYKVGDLASALDLSPCACGRFSPRLVSLVGRDNDNVELPGGKVINGEFFEFLFFGVPSVIQYQVVYRRSEGQLLVKLHLSEPDASIGDMIRNTMADKYGFTNTAVEYTDSFDKTPTGKLRFVYSVD